MDELSQCWYAAKDQVQRPTVNLNQAFDDVGKFWIFFVVFPRRLCCISSINRLHHNQCGRRAGICGAAVLFRHEPTVSALAS